MKRRKFMLVLILPLFMLADCEPGGWSAASPAPVGTAPSTHPACSLTACQKPDVRIPAHH